MNPLDLYLRHSRPALGVGASCVQTAPGQDTCFYDAGEKEPQVQQVLAAARRRLLESLSPSAEDASALRVVLADVQRQVGSHAGLNDLLGAMRAALRQRVVYRDDPPGRDTVQSLAATLRRGIGDCLSLTVALTAMAVAQGLQARWILAGDYSDPSRHIWPRIEGVAVEASDPMPALGMEYSHFTVRREVVPW